MCFTYEANLVETVKIKNNVVDAAEYEKMKAMKLETELAKYKRAFEILKDRLSLYVQDYEYPDKQNRYWIARTYDFGSTQITQEEYELLEELMKDD